MGRPGRDEPLDVGDDPEHAVGGLEDLTATTRTPPAPPPATSKTRGKCSRDPPLEAFNRDSHVRDSLRADCRDCQRIAACAWSGLEPEPRLPPYPSASPGNMPSGDSKGWKR